MLTCAKILLKSGSRLYSTNCVHRGILGNGIKIATAKMQGAPMASCTVMFQAGSRFEYDHQIGATHFIRACCDCSGQGYTIYAKSRILQQYGAYLSCSSDRQSISFTLRCVPSFFPTLKNYLIDSALRPSFHSWEINDKRPLVREDLARIAPDVRCMDLLQSACYRGSLANSVFCVDERVATMNSESLCKFVEMNFLTERCSIGSIGVHYEEVLNVADKLQSCADCCPREVPIPRAGYETYDLGAGSDTWVAFGIQCCGYDNPSEALKQAILAEACGTGNMQAGSNPYDRMPMCPVGLLSGIQEYYTNYKAFNICYDDCGLFGIMVKTRSRGATQAYFNILNFISQLGMISCEQINLGRERLKLNATKYIQDCDKESEDLAFQMACCVNYNSEFDFINMLDTICAGDVQCTAKCLASKWACAGMAVVGDIGMVPHDRDVLNKA